MQAMAGMSVEQREEALAALPPDQRRKVEAAQAAMLDMTHLSEVLKPSTTAPDMPLSDFIVIKGLATCPSMQQIDKQTPGDTKIIVETIDKIEGALRDEGALDVALIAECNALPRPQRRNVMLLYYQMRCFKWEATLTLDNVSQAQSSMAHGIALNNLVKAQMLLPQNRWVQATLAVARVSALLSCKLWSHSDDECKEAMAKVLESDGLPYPELRLEASASAKDRDEKEVLVSGVVKLDVVLYRDHVSKTGEKAAVQDNPANPQGILEAYWCFVEGVKPQPEVPNSLIAAQPMIVKSLDEAFVSMTFPFKAPPTVGKYPLKVHLISTSVIGINLTADAEFVVVEDDVPSLE